METYTEQKKRHSDEFGAFTGIFFAFNNEQFKEGLVKVENKEGEKVVSIGSGGYIRKDRVDDYIALCERHKNERQELKKDEKKLVEALVYELGNHEFCYTGDPLDAVEALGFTMETVPKKALDKAIKRQRKVVVA